MNSDVEADGTVTGINVTPLVDIMLVLLIIFMVTARLTSDAALKINLPKSAAANAAPTAAFTVTADSKGVLRLMDDTVDLNGLKSTLAREAGRDPSVRVTLAADGGLPYRQIVAILDAIKAAGVTRVALAAEK
ncbi:MAG TPA: biopolymer transporter ExbD [Elusimicrobiota bacterium]|nr:biopolymer transporter ExbD [Elusimicrobiota bacterium]